MNGSKSYAKVLSQDLSEVVKAAVSQTLASLRKNERPSLSVIIYSLSENNNDRSDMLSVLSSILCQAVHEVQVAYKKRTMGVHK